MLPISDISTLTDSMYGLNLEATYPEYEDGQGDFSHILTYGELAYDSDKNKFKSLAKLCGLKLSDIEDNLGFVKIQNYLMKFYGSPCIHKDTDDTGNEVLVLTIGVDRVSEGYNATKLKVTLSDNGSNNYLQLHTPRGDVVALNIDKSTIKRQKSGANTWLDFTIPLVTWYDDDLDLGYSMRVLCPDDFSWMKFQRAVQKGNMNMLLDCVASFKRTQWCSISHVFGPHFEANVFPVKGYVISVYEVDLVDGNYGPETRMRVDMTQIPGYSLNFGKEKIASSEVGVITFGTNHNGNRQARGIIENEGIRPTKQNPWYLWVKGPNEKNPKHVPVHLLLPKLLKPVELALKAQPTTTKTTLPANEASTPILDVEAKVIEGVDDFDPDNAF